MTRKLLLLAICAAAALPGSAHAQGKDRPKADRAQDLFDVALKMMDAGDYAPACALLEQSDQLDPGMGTKFRLAECYEKIGRIASAWTLFTEVADAAKASNIPEREQVARKRAAALEPRIARVTVQVPAEVAGLIGLEVRFRGQALRSERWDTPLPTDPGEHALQVTAQGKKPWTQLVRIDQPAQAVTVAVPVLEDAAAAPPGPTPPPPAATEPRGGFASIDWTPRRIAAAGAAGVGVVGLVVGTVFGATAASQWSDAKDTCKRDDFSRCTPAGVALAEDASSSATLSTLGFLIGIAGVGAGAYLWFTAPSPEPQPPPAPAAARRVLIAPALAPGHVGGVARISF